MRAFRIGFLSETGLGAKERANSIGIENFFGPKSMQRPNAQQAVPGIRP
jgi:hypothetical protein